LDRFWWSTYVYGLDHGVRESQLQLIIEVEKESWGSAIPDIVFLVDSVVPLRDDVPNTSEWQKKRQIYHQIASREKCIQKCIFLETSKGNKAKNKVLSEIWKAVSVLSPNIKSRIQ
jgi:thymidylate kinase